MTRLYKSPADKLARRICKAAFTLARGQPLTLKLVMTWHEDATADEIRAAIEFGANAGWLAKRDGDRLLTPFGEAIGLSTRAGVVKGQVAVIVQWRCAGPAAGKA